LTVLFIAVLIYISIQKFQFSTLENQLISLSGVVFVLVMIFCVLNFLMLRYLVVLLPIIILLFCMLLYKLLPVRIIYSMGLGLLLSGYFIYSNYSDFQRMSWHDDVSLNYTNIVRVHQQTVEYCEQSLWTDQKIFTHFLMQQNLTHPELGYLTSSSTFHYARYSGDILPDDDVIIFSCIEYDEGKHQQVKNDTRYQLIKRFEMNKAWSEVYTLREMEN